MEIHGVTVDRTAKLPIERRTLHYRAIAAPTKCPLPVLGCQVMLSCAVKASLRNQRYEKKD